LPHLEHPESQDGAEARRPPPLPADEPGGLLGAAGGPDAGGAGGGLVCGELQPGRRLQGHLGTEGLAMISRVADHCLWYGRYLERAESTARVLHVTRNLALDGELNPLQCWLPVLIVSGVEADFNARLGAPAAGDGEAVERYLAWAEENPTCILRSV